MTVVVDWIGMKIPIENLISLNYLCFVVWAKWKLRQCHSLMWRCLAWAMDFVFHHLLLNWPAWVNQSRIYYHFQNLRPHYLCYCHFHRSAVALNEMNSLVKYSLAKFLDSLCYADCYRMSFDSIELAENCLKCWNCVNNFTGEIIKVLLTIGQQYSCTFVSF